MAGQTSARLLRAEPVSRAAPAPESGSPARGILVASVIALVFWVGLFWAGGQVLAAISG